MLCTLKKVVCNKTTTTMKEPNMLKLKSIKRSTTVGLLFQMTAHKGEAEVFLCSSIKLMHYWLVLWSGTGYFPWALVGIVLTGREGAKWMSPDWTTLVCGATTLQPHQWVDGSHLSHIKSSESSRKVEKHYKPPFRADTQRKTCRLLHAPSTFPKWMKNMMSQHKLNKLLFHG